jgi:recombination associated protein RdgC
VGLAGGAISFQRFYVRGTLPSEVTDELVAGLSARSFGKLPAQSDGSHMGWIGPTHLFESELLPERIAVGPFVHLQLRVDVDRVPPAVLKSYVRMEEESILATTGREFLSRGERRQAKEAAQERAAQEAQAGAFRRIQAYPVVIDLAHGVVYLGNLSTGVADRLMAVFSDTFSASLDPATPEAVATRIMAGQQRARAVENLQPFHLVQPPMAYEEDGNGFSGLDLGFLG